MCKFRFLNMGAMAPVLGALAVLWPGAHAFAEDEEMLEISKRDCRRVVAYQPSGDVAYKPGVDVRGNKVTGADLPGSAVIETPKSLRIPLTLDIADLFSLPEGVAGEAPIGMIDYDIGSGKLEFNGKPLTDPQMAAIAAACAKLKN